MGKTVSRGKGTEKRQFKIKKTKIASRSKISREQEG